MPLYTLIRYLSLLAGDRIDVEDVVRISVENKICGEEGVSLDAFNVPQYLIYDRMNEVCGIAIAMCYANVDVFLFC